MGPITELEFEGTPYGGEEETVVAMPIAELVSVTEMLVLPVGPTMELVLDGTP